MGTSCATFAAVNIGLPIKPTRSKKKDVLAQAIEQLLTGEGQLLSLRNEREWTAILQFSSVASAIRTVGDFGRKLIAAQNAKFPFRIGLSTGEVSDRPSLTESCIRRAIWLSEIAPTSSILLSRSTAALAQDIELFPFWTVKHGDMHHVQEGRAEYIWLLRHGELPEPPPFLDDELARHNIPLADFVIGREDEIEEIQVRLQNSRWVTLVGPSGVGKSVVAFRVGREMCDGDDEEGNRRTLRDGVRYVNLTGVTTREEVIGRLFQSIGLQTDNLGPIGDGMIRAYFGNRRHLVLLDGCERSIPVLVPIVRSLLSTHSVSVLATSTSPFDHPSEDILRIDPLGVPPPDRHYTRQELESYEATALMLDRLRVVPNDKERTLIAEICRALGGHPLGITLAAKRARRESLQDVLRLVTGKHADSLDEKGGRHSSVHAAVRWTLENLDAATSRVLEWAAVFEDLWTQEDLAHFIGCEKKEIEHPIELLDHIGLIIENSPLESRQHGYRLEPHIRAAIRESLKDEEDWLDIREKHFLLFYGKFRELLPGMTGSNQADRLNRLDIIREDFEAALEFLIDVNESPGYFLEAMSHCWHYWYRRNRLRTGIALAEAGLALCKSSDRVETARLHMLASIFETKAGDSSSAQRRLRTALAVIEGLDVDSLKAKLLVNLAVSLWADAEPLEAYQVVEEAVTIARRTGDKSIYQAAISTSTPPMLDLKLYVECRERLRELEEITADSKDHQFQWGCRLAHGEYYCETKQYELSLKEIDAALGHARKAGDPALIGRCFLWRAQVLLEIGQNNEAAENLGRCLHLLSSGEQAPYKTNELKIAKLEGRLRNEIGDSQLNYLIFLGSFEENNLV